MASEIWNQALSEKLTYWPTRSSLAGPARLAYLLGLILGGTMVIQYTVDSRMTKTRLYTSFILKQFSSKN